MKKPYVAIVDDDSAFAAYLRTFLSLRGYEARCYTRGDELLASMKQSEPPDVVLLDVMMPGLDGLATLRALKAAEPETQVIMLSGREPGARPSSRRSDSAPPTTSSSPTTPRGSAKSRSTSPIKNAIEKTRLVSELTELRQQLSDDEDRAVLGQQREDARRSRRSSSRWPTATSPSSSAARAASAKSSSRARSTSARTRRNRPFVKVNCAALPAELLESELFGHERGAFTGAATTRIGKFEQADSGTSMLDEIGEMKPALQAKLLHVLQDAEFTKLGSNKRIQVDVRVVAATNRDLEKMMVSGEFREDLYYRLKVIELTVPPLRERRDEIPTLTDFFIARYSRKYNRPVRPLSDELRRLFLTYDWPGNIRELENMIKRIVILQDEQLVVAEIQRNMRKAEAAVQQVAPPLPVMVGAAAGIPIGSAAVAAVGAGGIPVMPVPASQPFEPQTAEPYDDAEPSAGGGSLAAVAKAAAMKAERVAIEQTLRQVHWNRRKASQILGVSYKTLLNKIKESGISRA